LSIFRRKKVLLRIFYQLCKDNVVILLLFLCFSSSAQSNFRFPKGKTQDKIKFKLSNNLIIIPVTLNGVKLSFILDTGVGSTIVFSLENRESLEVKNAEQVLLKGLGGDGEVEAIKSIHNTMKIGSAINSNHTTYIVLDTSINFSPQMGFPVHGVIGFDFFKDFVVEIKYSSKTLRLYDPGTYRYKKCKKCYQADLRFPDGKRPYMDIGYDTEKGQRKLNMLIDLGSASALWLFENEALGVRVPKDGFEDFLGKGFSGDIYGQNSKINRLTIGDFVLNNVTTSFPYSTYLEGVLLKERQGSIGGGVFRRFDLKLDYVHRKITLKKNGYFKKPFYYNMSGLTVLHNGLGQPQNSVQSLTRLKLESFLKPEYIISHVRPDSPADHAGLKKGDAILVINGKKSYTYELSELNALFYEKEGKKMKMKIERNGIVMKYEFYLEKVLK